MSNAYRETRILIRRDPVSHNVTDVWAENNNIKIALPVTKIITSDEIGQPPKVILEVHGRRVEET